MSDEIVLSTATDDFPWSKCERGNHSEAEQQIAEIYQGVGLKPPRAAWALSPPALFTAIQMLRAVHVGQRHKFIEAMVQADDPIASAKRTLLDAITDRNVMTTMGAALGRQLFGNKNHGEIPCIWDLSEHLRYYDSRQHKSPLPVSTPARFGENTIYGAFSGGALARNTLLFLPYVHLAWLCEPPIKTLLWPNGHLETMRFADGYTVYLHDPEAEKPNEQYPALPSECYPALSESTEVITRRVLFTMCALGTHEGCSGIITEQMAGRVETYCTCACHEKKELEAKNG